MNIVRFPTDNLYKFVAISGLLLFTISAFYLFWHVHELQRKGFETWRDTYLLMTDIEEMTGVHRIESGNQTQDKTVSLEHYEENAHKLGEVIDQAIRALDQDMSDNKLNPEVGLKIRRKYIELGYKVRMLEWYTRVTKETRFAAFAGILVGGVFILVGFILWQVRIQNYHDLILKNRAKTRS